MAVDVAAVCSTADANQGSQALAIVLSVMFSIYTVVAIALSALTIYSTSQVPLQDSVPAQAPIKVGVSAGPGAPLVSLKW